MDLLRPYLSPLTHSLPAPLVRLGHSLLGPTCYAQLLLDLDLRPSPCLSLAVSKALGLGIIALSSIVKVPQILKLTRARSAAGISLLGCALETSAYLVTLAYSARQGFPFTSYGETALIAVQDLGVCALVLLFSGWGQAVVVGAGVGVLGVVWALMDARVVDAGVLKGLQAGAGVLGVASKAPQIWTVWREGGTGQLSAFGVSFSFSFSLSDFPSLSFFPLSPPSFPPLPPYPPCVRVIFSQGATSN